MEFSSVQNWRRMAHADLSQSKSHQPQCHSEFQIEKLSKGDTFNLAAKWAKVAYAC